MKTGEKKSVCVCVCVCGHVQNTPTPHSHTHMSEQRKTEWMEMTGKTHFLTQELTRITIVE